MAEGACCRDASSDLPPPPNTPTLHTCRGGVVDGAHQGLLLLLAAIGPEEANQVRQRGGGQEGGNREDGIREDRKKGRPSLPSHSAHSACAALIPPPLPQVRLGPLSPHAVRTLRALRDFFGVTFNMKTERESRTIFLTCIGAGIKNMSKKVT